MKKYLVSVLVFVTALVLVACNGGGGKKIKIGVVMPDASEERWKNQDGVFLKNELDKLGAGYEYEILFSDADEAKEKANVEALIARGAKVIIITAHGSGAGAVEAAKAAGVKVIAHDRMSKSDKNVADYYTTFNSWNVGKAQGQHLVDMALAKGATAENKMDLAIYSGRTADWPNATYFFGGAMEALHPHLDKFNIVTVNKDAVLALKADAVVTEATFNDAAKTKLQAAMATVDTDWNPGTAKTLAEATVPKLPAAAERSEAFFVLAPNDDTSAAIRQVFDEIDNPYAEYYTTGQDASDVTVASLMGDKVKGKGVQTMTVFKDTSKLSADSVKIAKNVVDGKTGAAALEGLTTGPKIDGAETAYSAIDVLLKSNPQHTYDLIFKSGYKKESNATFSNIDFAPYKK